MERFSFPNWSMLLIMISHTFSFALGNLNPHPTCLATTGELTQTTHLTDLVFHPVTRKCYELSRKGPCGDNMLLYRHPFNPQFGFCDCNQGVRSEKVNVPVRKTFYSPKLRKCIPVFSQGTCRINFWLNYHYNPRSKQGQFFCEPNPCLEIQRSKDPKYDWKGQSQVFWFYDPIKRSCYQSETQGYCPDGEFLELTNDSHLPSCRSYTVSEALTRFSSHLTCQPGSRYSYLWRGCLKSIPKFRYGIIG